MKNAFNISVPDDREYPRLMVYLNEETLAFLEYAGDPFHAGGLQVYQFGQQAITQDWIAGLTQAIRQNDRFANVHSNAQIFLDFQDTVLSPSEIEYEFSPEMMIASAYGGKTDQRLMKQPEVTSGITIHHQVPAGVVEWLENSFPGSIIKHASGCLLSNNEDGACLQVVVFAHTIKTILHIDGNLQFIGSADYRTSTDAVYHLLNLCRNYDVDPASLTLLLNGMIDSQSILYEDIYRYFMNVKFDGPEDSVLSSTLAEYPAHFFNYFIRLAKCAS